MRTDLRIFQSVSSSSTDKHPRKPFPWPRIWVTLGFIFLTLLFFLPLYWMIVSSVRPQSEIFAHGFDLTPSSVTFENYRRLFSELPFQQWYINTLVQSLSFAVLSVAVCMMGGFALAKYKFPFRNFTFISILTMQMIPFHLLIVSLFVMVVRLDLVDTLWGAILPLAAHPIGIFFMRQYLLSLDDELLNAARVDGANELQVFYSIVLPHARPATATLLILFTLEYWNNLLWPIIVFRNADNFPLAVGISTLVSTYRSQYDLVMAASVLTTLPIIILFFFFRRQFMAGIAISGTGIK